MKLKYKCLILDHDDTAVKSTPEIHYPSFLASMKVLRPDAELTIEDFTNYCFNPGFMELCKDILKYSTEEQEYQYKIWREYTTSKIPDFYEGFIEILEEFRKLGGIITVVSHSEKDQIERHYSCKSSITPDLILGWELEESKRKPSTYPVKVIMDTFDLKESEVLVVDDLKPGMDMANNSNVTFACAGWSHQVKDIEQFMKEKADVYFSSVEDFRKYLFESF
ncbi:HAD family hydrolase [Vallitalea okinawensis]|uniref:HAD family hydrolase n=1 Tax=Vallitalea okinawensis TaxID=2078660 RepID=UPI000CFBDCC4|nr:HAD hydrolase-like protein [Vallitalea okinawensis]